MEILLLHGAINRYLCADIGIFTCTRTYCNYPPGIGIGDRICNYIAPIIDIFFDGEGVVIVSDGNSIVIGCLNFSHRLAIEFTSYG